MGVAKVGGKLAIEDDIFGAFGEGLVFSFTGVEGDAFLAG